MHFFDSFLQLMDVPWKTWDVRRKITPPPEVQENCSDTLATNFQGHVAGKISQVLIS